MDYRKIHDSIIERSRIREADNVYYERHHVIPRSLGGTNAKENIVKLSAREHFIIHRLLFKMTNDGAKRSMAYALHRMMFSKTGKRDVLSSRKYETARKELHKFLKDTHASKTDPNYTEKHKARILKSWDDADDRRAEHSAKMSESITKWLEENHEEHRRISALGGAGVKNKWKNDEEWAAEQKRKISKYTSGSKNGMFGYKVMNDGKTQRKVTLKMQDQYVKDGWEFGSLKSRLKGGVGK